MTAFNHGAPGVEWSAESVEPTIPLRPIAPESPYPSACVSCGGELGIDGYCLKCGQKAKSLREHYELTPVDWVAGVCDIGLVHAHNEDALACQASSTRAVVVVCDGVTTSEASDVASMAAAQAACTMVWANNPQGTGTPSSRAAAIEALLTQAVEAANQAVIEGTDPASHNSAATTIALALIDDNVVSCVNLGDSRVYWFPDGGVPCQLSKDHSLAQDGIDSGAGRAEAEASLFAHTITKWLGRDATDLVPHYATITIDVSGWLVVCTDGLWNFASEASAMSDVIGQCGGEDPTPLDLASRLVAWANEQGGHDNVTVSCARLKADTQGVAPSSTESEGPTLPAPIHV
ncbi:MAG: serine/threonine-protein phosphatase [Propionibacteriaceae bacterium]|nr:serine/threonine-protein phosphatase [Propionibacteriaceae bacterium]